MAKSLPFFSGAKVSKEIGVTTLLLITYNLLCVYDDLVTQVAQGLVTELNTFVSKCGTDGSRRPYIWHWK